MMKQWVALMGANATGKSTRMFEYVKTLGPADRVFDYTFEKNGEMRTVKQAGHIWGNIFVVGRPARDGKKWVGGDYTMGRIGTKAHTLEFLASLEDEGIDTVVFEAYFNTNSLIYHPDTLYDIFDKVNNYWFYYDTLEEFAAKTAARSGRTWEEREADPEEAAGWKNNKTFVRVLERTSLQIQDGRGSVERVSYTEPRDWLSTKMKEL